MISENLIAILKKDNKLPDIEQLKFKVKPVFEENKKYNSTDDVVRKWAYHNIDFGKAEYPFEELIKLLSVVQPRYPLWINIDSSKYFKEKLIFLEISMRFRKPSQLLNKELGFPPFNLISYSDNPDGLSI